MSNSPANPIPRTVGSDTPASGSSGVGVALAPGTGVDVLCAIYELVGAAVGVPVGLAVDVGGASQSFSCG